MTGVDLTRQQAVNDLMKYLETHKPLVVIMAPPCTTMGGWSHVRQVRDPKAFEQERAIGEKLANLCARVALIQLESGRHFLVENQRGSELFGLRGFLALTKTGRIVKCNFPQCAAGLRSPDGMPILKFTTIWASDERLV